MDQLIWYTIFISIFIELDLNWNGASSTSSFCSIKSIQYQVSIYHISVGWFKGKNTGRSHDLHGKIYGFRLRFSLICQPIEWANVFVFEIYLYIKIDIHVSYAWYIIQYQLNITWMMSYIMYQVTSSGGQGFCVRATAAQVASRGQVLVITGWLDLHWFIQIKR